MEIPEKIKIGGHWYDVEYPYLFKEKEGLAGQSDHACKKIRVTNVDPCGIEVPDSSAFVALIHEVLHCIDHNTGFHMFNLQGDTHCEAKIEAISEGIFALLVDNGWLNIDEG